MITMSMMERPSAYGFEYGVYVCVYRMWGHMGWWDRRLLVHNVSSSHDMR